MWMMWVVLLVVAVAACVGWRMAERAAARRQWIKRMHGARSGTLGIGISALVAGDGDVERCERLLEVEYAPFEVVMVVDFERDKALADLLRARYHLMRVDYRPSGEFPVRGVQGLYRSLKRRFRRLVVVDCRVRGERAAFDAAADVATYDYLLPLRRGEFPVAGAVEQLATELALQPLDRIDRIVHAPSMRTLVWRRAALSVAGGFPGYVDCRIRSSRRLVVWGAWLRGVPSWGGRISAVALALLLLLVGVCGWCSSGAWLPLLAWAVVLLFALLCRARIGQLNRGDGENRSKCCSFCPKTDKVKKKRRKKRYI